MGKGLYTFFILSFLLISLQGQSQSTPKEKGLEAIKIESVQAPMEFLASDWTEGRETGKTGIYMAADYIAGLFKLSGIQPAGDEKWVYPSREERMKGKQPYKTRSYFQKVPMVKTVVGNHQEVKFLTIEGGVKSGMGLAYKTDFVFSGAECSQEFEAPLVFVGYGLQDLENGYDDFKGIDVRGKIVLRLQGFPGHGDTNSVAYKKFRPKDRYAMYMLNRKKNETAQKLGALAIIEYSEEDPSTDWSSNIPFRFNTLYYEGDKEQETTYDTRLSLPGKELGKSLVRITLSKRAMSTLLKNSGIDIAGFEIFSKNQMKPAGKIILGKSIYANLKVESEIISCQNVLGMIEGKNPDELIVLGAHYDHLGKYNGVIWNGADDNASGTVGIITIARAFAESGIKPEKTIVFALWTGEEKGLLGSSYYVQNQMPQKEKIRMNLNYDMISRDNADDTLGVQCSMSYLEGNDRLMEISKKNNEDFKLGLQVRYRKSAPGAGGGSDHAPFSRENIPFMYFMAGFPKEYHQPIDHLELINWEKMTKIIKLGYLNIFDIATQKN